MKAKTLVSLGVLIAVAACGDSLGGEWDLNFTISNIKPGKAVYGKPVTPQDLEYRVVLLEVWGMRCPPCVGSLPMLSKWQDDYKSRGLAVVGAHCQGGSDDALSSFVKKQGVTYTIWAGGGVKGADFRGIPHCFLFDATGQCTYRGSPYTVLPELKEALAKAPFAALGGRELVKLKSISDGLKHGMPPSRALKKAQSLVESKDAETADEAKFVVESLTNWGEKLVEEAKAKKDTDPAGCAAALRRASRGFSGTDVAKRASEALAELKGDRAFQAELKAAQILEKIKALEQRIRARADEDPTTDKFRKRNHTVLKNIRGGVRVINKKYPDSRAAAEAGAIAAKYGLN